MKTQSELIAEYRDQIRRCARTLAVAKTDIATRYLAPSESIEMVEIYAEGNLDKRTWKLNDQFEFMKEDFEKLDDWIKEYISTVPLVAYDTGCTDSVIFLDWVEENCKLTPEQLDYITCHRSRIDIEELARVNRMGHIRFQEILSATNELAAEMAINRSLWIHLNPIRVWAKFETNVLIEEDDDTPATVIFFPLKNDVRTVVLEPVAQMVIDELESKPSCKLSDLTSAFPYEQIDAVIEICRDLAELGLVAFG
jgi:hypothetical protein